MFLSRLIVYHQQEHFLTPYQPETRPTSSHTSGSGIETDTGSINAQSRHPISDTVETQLRSKLLPSNNDHNLPSWFLPLSDLESTMSEEVVNAVVVEALQNDENEATEIRKKMCKMQFEPSRIKILATLILIRKAKYIRHFLDHGICDDKLPLLPDHPVFRDWKASYVDSFYDRQFVVFVPVFDFRTLKHCEFHAKAHMPYLERLKWEAGGAHGTISKIRIHPDHRRWTRPSVRRPVKERCV